MFNNELWQKPAGGAGGSGFYTHQIANSCRFNHAGYLNDARASDGSATTGTISFWFKRSAIGSAQFLMDAREDGNNYMRIQILADDTIEWQNETGASMKFELETTQVFRDTSAWYHFVGVIDMTNGTQGNRAQMYINGERVTVFDVETYPADASQVTALNTAANLRLGNAVAATVPFDGYMAEMVVIDGTAQAVTDMGETKNGVWIPKDPSGLTFSTNGFYLKVESSGDLGNDSSGNNNDFVATSLSPHDQMLDSPTFGSEGSANFPTINVLDPTITVSAISEGNLKITEGNGLGGKATFAVPLTGKWYWEAYVNNGANQEMWAGFTGITTNSSGEGRGGSSNSNTYGASWSNYSGSNMYIRKYIAGTESAESGSFGPTSDTIIGIAVNRDDNEAKFYKNNALQFTTAISATQEYFPAGGMGGGNDSSTIQVWNFGQDGTFAGNETAQGNADGNGYGNFYYAPPTDFLSLNTANLPTADSIDPAQTDDNYPQELFFMSKYSGNGTNRTITTENQPDLIWLRSANTAQDWYVVDSTRVITDNKYILTNVTDAEATLPQSNFTSVGATSVGISSGTWLNSNGSNYKMWMWRANGGTTSTNSSGSLSVTQQVDPSGSFSISTYNGDGGTDTIGHGLSSAPTMVIVKQRNGANNWAVYAKGAGNTKYGYLDSTGAFGTAAMWQNTTPSSSLVYLGDNNEVNAGSRTYVAYCFADTEGYIKSGSYVGNGDANGSFVYTGFKPAFLLYKNLASGESWVVIDNQRNSFNVAGKALFTEATSAESNSPVTYGVDLLSNGFKARATNAVVNGSGANYIYLAFAENPFKYATAR